MKSPDGRETSIELDRVDRQLIHALQTEPRVPFSLAADVIGVSEQTIARRYRRMQQAGLVRVIGVVDHTVQGQSGYLIRVHSRPGSVGRLAHALADRADVTWVTICAGGTEIVAAVRSPSSAQRDELLLQRLPNAGQVTNVATALVLHRFRSADGNWHGYGDPLDIDQVARIAHPSVSAQAVPTQLRATDARLTATLAHDGRTSWAALATATGSSRSYVTDRVAALRASGILYFDVDIVTEMMGFRSAALLWLTVTPAHLTAAGDTLATHDEVSFAAAVSGPANLFATVVCRDTAHLFDYLTTKLAATDGLIAVETSPVLRRIKQKAPLTGAAHPARLSNPVR